ncbi:hypothetical protein [Sinorhizobium meliloti]|uniref:hypothetical protein n=1 Tax=Rhizobium meliloti TaxID=382 RepID=UPI001AEFBACD|nr:hypothetical protein [Sinorhizobium meliloti]
MAAEPICWLHLRHQSAGRNFGTDLINVAGAHNRESAYCRPGEFFAYLGSYSLATRNDEIQFSPVCRNRQPAPLRSTVMTCVQQPARQGHGK